MLIYITRRLLLMFPTLIGMTIVIFMVMAFSPGGISQSLLSAEGMMKPNERKQIEADLDYRYGLDKPLPIQYLRWLNKVSPIGFATYQLEDKEVIDARAAVAKLPPGSDGKAILPKIRAGDMILTHPTIKTPDLGRSAIRKRPVIDLIKECLPVTLLCNLIVFPFVYMVSISSGIKMAQHRGKWLDVSLGTIYLGLWSMPGILVSVLMIGFLACEQYPRLHYFPANGMNDMLAHEMPYLPHWGANGFERGYLLDMGWHLVLPLICMGYGQMAFLSKLARGSVLENLLSDYARTARAKGVSGTNVLFRHVFRNSLIPLITVAANILPAMLGGAVIFETVFGLNGMGRLAVNAVFEKDPELVLSTAMVSGLLGLIGYLLADIGYAIADPRVGYDN